MSNNQFTKVNALAQRLSNLQATDGEMDELNVNSIVSPEKEVNYGQSSEVKEGVIVAYAPTEFATLAEDGVVSLLNVPGEAAATADSDDRLARVPVGSYVTEVYVDNNGTTIAGNTSIDLSVAAFDTAGTSLLDTCLLATQNSGAARIFYDNTAAGVALSATGASNYVTVEAVGGANTDGDLRVVIKYVEVTDV